MKKPLWVISFRRRKRRPGGSTGKPGTAFSKTHGMSPEDKRMLSLHTRSVALLILLMLATAAVLVSYWTAHPPVVNLFEQSQMVRGVKLFVSSKMDPEQDQALKFVLKALEQRTALLLTGDVEQMADNYDLDSSTGVWAYENEVNRVMYLRKWAQSRNVRMVEAASTFEVDSVTKEGDGRYWIELTEHTRYAYEYPQTDDFAPVMAHKADAGLWVTSATWDAPPLRHEFGSRAVHVVEVIKTEQGWKIRKDWYQDPLGNNVSEPGQEAASSGLTQAVSGAVSEVVSGAVSEAVSEVVSDLEHLATPTELTLAISGATYPMSAEAAGMFDREKALRYAVKHSGVRSLPDGGKYNPKYKVYTFAGGDCANFASQVLHAGGIPMGHRWHYTKEGSTAWVQSESLVWHLLSSGWGIRLFRGTFREAGTGMHPDSPAAKLEPGDIIAYERKGQLCHVAVVVGKDPRGYVTIASHTADRLYFPWDLGWDDSTVFWFVKITY